MKRPKDAPRRRLAEFLLAVAVLILLFSLPLYRLARLSLHSSLFSYIPLVPFISLGLVLLKRWDLPPPSAPDRRLASFSIAAGMALLAGGWFWRNFGAGLSWQNSVALSSLSFVLIFVATCAWFWGRPIMRSLAFPVAFLALMAPIPNFLTGLLVDVLQYASAAVAHAFFELYGTPVMPVGELGFQLPGINLEVAPECSGLHSTLALMITSLPAGYLFLRSPWKRAVLTFAAIPLGILRNGFRIFTIGELCVHIGPQMINSYIHTTGGWMFFILSLGLFLPLIFFLIWLERRPSAGTSPTLGA
jgi:exosortase C (VPDSG-CTERM-specific)